MDARLIRCLLFVPGDRPDRFAKAEAAGADGVSFDLEDAVSPWRKDEARVQVVRHLEATAARGGVARVVRTNRAMTPVGARDLDSLARSGANLDFVMLPKV